MKHWIVALFGAASAIALAGCNTTRSDAAALEYSFESDAAAHVFYQAILDGTTLPLQTKKTYLNTPLLVVKKVNQASGASISREAAAKADLDRDLRITEVEAKAFSGSPE